MGLVVIAINSALQEEKKRLKAQLEEMKDYKQLQDTQLSVARVNFIHKCCEATAKDYCAWLYTYLKEGGCITTVSQEPVLPDNFLFLEKDATITRLFGRNLKYVIVPKGVKWEAQDLGDNVVLDSSQNRPYSGEHCDKPKDKIEIPLFADMIPILIEMERADEKKEAALGRQEQTAQ